ncbi:ABC-three component system protein [Agromyces bauzanensis]
MFVRSIGSTDKRFRPITFRDGLNILVAERSEGAVQGDSRNSVGKTSVVLVLRYLLGSSLPNDFKAPELVDHVFTGTFDLPDPQSVGIQEVYISRAVSPTTRVRVHGWSATNGKSDVHIDEWRELLARHLFHVPATATRPTVGQLWGQLIRSYFGNPTKGHGSEADWESGAKLGHLLGLSSELLSEAGDIVRLKTQSKVLNKAVQEGAVSHLALDESSLRAQVANARRQRDKTAEELSGFRVDERYADHQDAADSLTARIGAINDETLSLRRRQREIAAALFEKDSAPAEARVVDSLTRLYAELGVVLNEAVARRYEEVEAFHHSVVRNRRSFLERESQAVGARLTWLDASRRRLDTERADIMTLLQETVALNTFMEAQKSLARLEAEVADLERRLESASSLSGLGDQIKIRTANLTSAVRTELNERAETLEAPIAMFSELGGEIYTEREARLLIKPTSNGLLNVEPRISGDRSTGVQGVETFILDIVSVITAISLARAPRILVHDSHLFDATDGRQVASCLNIGARLADAYDFQYIVTMNSDFLDTVETQSDGAFDAAPYILDTKLSDEGEDGGLFGFRFD